MTVRKDNLPAEVRKPDDRTVQTADQVIAEIAAKIAPYKPKPEWEGMSPEEMFRRGWEYNKKEEYTEAMKWWRRAAEQGYPPRMRPSLNWNRADNHEAGWHSARFHDVWAYPVWGGRGGLFSPLPPVVAKSHFSHSTAQS